MEADLNCILSEVASCNLDILLSSKRYEVIQEAETLLFSSDGSDNNDNDGNDGNDGNDTNVIVNALLAVVSKCYSKQSRNRIANLIAKLIIRIINNDITTDDSTDADSDVDDHLKQLWIAYSQTIAKACISKTNSKNTKNKNVLASSFVTMDTIIRKNCTDQENGLPKQNKKNQIMQRLYDCIWNVFIAVDNISNSNSGNNDGVWAICLSFLTHLSSTSSSTSVTSKDDSELMEYFIQYTFKQQQFASHQFMPLCHSFLERMSSTTSSSSSTSISSLLSIMGLKLRANPETVLPISHSILYQMNPSTTTSTIQQELSSNLFENAKLLPFVIKQLTSSKEQLRQLSSDVLLHLSTFESCFVTIVDSILSVMGAGTAKATTPKITGVKLTSSDHRLVAYTTLRNIALSYLKTKSTSLTSTSTTSSTSDSVETMMNNLFQVLSTVVTKESTASSSKEAGITCLITWMVLYKEMKFTGTGTGTDGYSKAIEFMTKPILDLNKKSSSMGSGNEFRSRVGSLFITSKFTNNDIVSHDTIQQIIHDMIDGKKNTKTILDGLQSFVDSSIKKHGKSSIVPQIDGLIATYILLLHSKKDASSSPISPSLKSKVLLPGSSPIDTSSDSTTSKPTSASFLYSNAMTDASRTDMIVNTLLHQTIALASPLFSKGLVRMKENTNGDDNGKDEKQPPCAAAYALACCIASPNLPGCTISSADSSVFASVEQVLSNASSSNLKGSASDAITTALLYHMNSLIQQRDETGVAESRESSNDGTLDKEHYRAKFDINMKAIRDISYTLVGSVTDAEHFAQVLILSHYGTTLKTFSKKQRFGLEKYVTRLLSKVGIDKKFSSSDIAEFLVKFVISNETTDSMCKAALSLIKTLGSIGGNFDVEFHDPDDSESNNYEVAWTLCVKELATKMSESLSTALEDIDSLTANDAGLYHSMPGVLYVSNSESAENNTSKIVKSKKGTEDEEWEKQVKEEIARKKAAEGEGSSSSQTLTEEDKKLLSQQTIDRKRICHLIDVHFKRCLNTIQSLCLSDVEIGNSVLPDVASSVTRAATLKCEASKSIHSMVTLGFETLCSLASCVYEIDESHSISLAKSLSICQKSDKKQMSVIPFPSSCDAAAMTIQEMDEYDDCLSGNSFAFLFPILRAALTGPRSTNGCDAALRVLDRHTELLVSDKSVKALRKDMASAVLALLTHDRSKTFSNPTPVETLINVYTSETKFSPSEIAPLLGSNGSLGVKHCRLASMRVVASILSKQPKMIKTNPLVENRIWMNCFSSDKDIKSEASQAWKIGHGVSDETDLPPPSKMFAIALTPLLSHKDSDIAKAAADAYAYAMEKYSETVGKNLTILFKSYIESYPTSIEDGDQKASEPPKVPAIVKPKAASKPSSKLSVNTKKTTKVKKKIGTSAISNLTSLKKKTTKRKTGASITLTTKKKERTLDKDVLSAQFKPNKDTDDTKTEKDSDEKKAVRLGVLRVVAASTKCDLKLETSTLKLLVVFLLGYGLADLNESVRVSATNTLRDVASSGLVKDAIEFLLPLLEASLKNGKVDKSYLEELPTEKVFESTAAGDNRKEGVVIVLGAAAVHLNNQRDAEKINETCDMLIATLSTPSESVQSSVALCLSKLMKKGNMQGRTETLLSQLMNDCLRGKTLANRRGSAYGISAVVKGSGIACLKKFEIVTKLEEACSAGSSTEKEGALFAIELLSNRLGLLFEPYVIVLLPSLLQSFGDTSIHVRQAANSSIGLVMSKLSGHGVKLLMPAVLSALENEDWRTKQASIHMLGAMSHCAPKQLASCLPRVVPKLTESFSDTHPKVKSSAKDALEEISKVIRNPEISEISATLLLALTDPSNSTSVALEALIETEFLHAIDAASLSLIVPVLHRGLRDRAATTKRYAALIAGNICTMINEPKDFIPYLPMLLPDLKGVLVDPIPDCRSISAKALGSLTRTLGEATFPDLRPWLINTLKSDEGSSVERSGAAQGLTEVICAGGARLVDSVMRDEILPLISHPNAAYREGVLWVLTFLPSSLGQAFAPLIESAFPALISGLSDESEPVRDVAMRAGRVTIRSNGKAHVDKILPSLEQGLGNEDYRIRAASLNLMGDLLSCIGGSKVSKTDGDSQDDIRQAERAQAQIALVLGPEIRKRVLSSLYIRRSDSAAVVRQSAVQVWKSVVSVTPRTLKEILDTLVGQIVTALASGHPDHTQVAGRCLGDIVSKLGDTVLPEIIPVLRDALYRGDVHTRIGACVGLNEVIACSSKEQIAKYLEILVKAVQDALCDDLEKVRGMAASCFQSLYSVVGIRALDEVVPALLVGMESSANDDQSRMRSINGLTSILKIRSKELLPYLVPRLLKKPITKNQAIALGSIYTVTGNYINHFVSSIIPTFLAEIVALQDVELDEEEKSREEALRDCLRSLFSCIGENGLNVVVSEIAGKCSSDKAAVRTECCWMFKLLVEERKEKCDFYEQIPIILRELLYRLNDECDTVLKATNAALSTLSKHVSSEELVNHIEFIRNLIASMVSESRRRKGGVGDGEFLLPGFNRPKGLEPLLPIYQRGILYGSSAIREVSAAGLGELVSITASKYLAGAFVIKLTGPLLRIVGDRNPSSVKIAIIQTLGLILTKGGPSLRAFVPQFQTTFSKALTDPARQVRVEAIKALGLLMPLSTRVDPLLKELVSSALGNGAVSGLDAAGVVAVQTATMEALATVLKHGGKKAKLPTSIPSALNAGKEGLFNAEEGVRIGAAKVIASACELLGAEATSEVVVEILENEMTSEETKHGLVCFCRYILSSSVGSCLEVGTVDTMKDLSIGLIKDDSMLVKEMACTAAAVVMGAVEDSDNCMKSMEKSLLKCMNSNESMEVLKGIAKGLCIASQLKPQMFLSTKNGHFFLEAALENAMCGNQRVQLAYNDFLWLALDVKDGDEGLLAYTEVAMFDRAKKMKSLYSKVLVRMKQVDLET